MAHVAPVAHNTPSVTQHTHTPPAPPPPKVTGPAATVPKPAEHKVNVKA